MKTENKKYKDSASRAQKCACTNSAEALPILERKFKDSGIPWIGMIPEDWEVCRLKNLHTDSNVGESIDKTFCSDNPNDILFYTAGLKPIHTTYLDFPKWKYTHKSNLLLSRNGTPYVYVPKENAVYSDHIIRIDIDNRFSKEFVRYCLQQAIASVVVDSVSIATWSISLWDKQNIPLPPLPTQQRIADFLDRKCAEIDELAALQETMIAELKRYKQSVITEAVTKGLDKNVKMKDSSVEWIGEIPEGWEVKKGKHVLSLLKREVREDDEVVTCFRDGEVILRKERREDGFTMSDKEIGYQGINKGDIVIHGMDGFAGAMGVSKSTGKGSPVLIVCIPSHNDYPQYIIYYLRTLAMRNVFLALATGIRERSCDLRWNKISELAFLLPPLTEQRAIADYLDCKCAEIDELIAIKQQKIEQLKEYKKSVIFEYVTGKKEI